MIAIDLANLVHQFFAESELMVEDYNTSTGKPSTTSYRTHIQLFDPNKNPRLLKSVKVWASDTMTITSGGKTYVIDTNKSAWLIDIIGNNNQQKRCPRKTPITLSLKQKDWAFLRLFLFSPVSRFSRANISYFR
jgi:hypothetical protein